MEDTIRVPNDIAEHFGVPEFVSAEELAKLFPSVPVNFDGMADWSAYADIFSAYEDHRRVVSISDNRRALVLARYQGEVTRIHCSQPQSVVE